MAYIFGDGFDLYATATDMTAGYWDSGTPGTFVLTTGRFSGSQAINIANAGFNLTKSSGVNDAIHHIVCAFRQTSALTGTFLGVYFQFIDNVTNQCCIVFRSDGVILLTSATPAGTVLATYSGAVTAINTWYAFEFEVIINNTTGRFRARKNGNTVDDFDSGATLNTRPGANAYANKLILGQSAANATQQLDDFLWRSDASSVAFLGDIRCYTRMPTSDASVQFARSPNPSVVTPYTSSGGFAFVAGTAIYGGFTATFDGTVSTILASITTGFTGNLKGSLFSTLISNRPGTVLGSATTINNPTSGTNTFTFSTPVAVTKGTGYYFGIDPDTSSGSYNGGGGVSGWNSTTSYASFPVANPTIGGNASGPIFSALIVPAVNAQCVNETLQDAATTYVYDGTVGHADLYNLAALPGTPATTIAVTTRGFVQKSDAGARQGAIQLKSGATTVQASTGPLSAGSWAWVYRTDAIDPNTGSAWTATAVNNAQIGPIVTA